MPYEKKLSQAWTNAVDILSQALNNEGETVKHEQNEDEIFSSSSSSADA